MTASASVALECFDGVALGGVADVAALGIQNHRHVRVGAMDVVDRALELVFRFVRRVVRELRLVGAHEVRRGVDDRLVELEDRRGSAAIDARHALDLRVEPHADERVVALPDVFASCSMKPVMRRGSGREAALLQMHEQDRHRRRRDARDARGLADGRRLDLGELLPHFGGEACDGRVVQVRWQRGLLVAALAVDLVLLPLDVAGVLGAHFDLRADLRRQTIVDVGIEPDGPPFRRADHFEQRRVVHFRPAQQLEAVTVARRAAPSARARGHSAETSRRLHARALSRATSRSDSSCLLLEQRPALVVDQPELAPGRREPQIRVVLTQQQPVLGAAREHAVGLARAARDEVIDEHAEVGLAALRHPGVAALHCSAALMPATRPCAAASS